MRKGSQQSITTVADIEVEEASFIDALRRREVEAERALVRQIRSDFQSGGQHAPGLVLLQKAVRSKIVGTLQHRTFGGDIGMAEEAWNDALYRIWSRIEGYDETRSRFLTAPQVAELLSVPESWVREHTRNESLPRLKLGRYRRYRLESILHWLEKQEGNPALSRRGRSSAVAD
jgi:excisionase family DNA binding protein